MSSDVQAEIRSFIAGRYPQSSIGDDEDIFAVGFINSLFALELVMFIEKTFGITIPTSDLQLDYFRTVAAMAALVERQADPAGQGGGAR